MEELLPQSLIARVATILHARLVFGRRVRAIARHAANLLPEDCLSVLDVGCGDGTLARTILLDRPSLTIEGLEIRARPSTAIPVREFDGASIPSEDNSFDAVIIVDVLHHAEDPLALLREAARVARVAVIVKDHLADPWLGSRRLQLMDWIGNVGHGVPLRNGYWTRAQWADAFRAAGLLEVERKEDLGLYPIGVGWLFESGLHFIARLDVDRGGSRREVRSARSDR